MIPLSVVASLMTISLVFCIVQMCRQANLIRNLTDANEVLDMAMEQEYTVSQSFRKERDKAREKASEHEKIAAQCLKELVDEKEKFRKTLAAAEKDRCEARKESHDFKIERDFHHTACESVVKERDEMQKELQQCKMQSLALLELNEVLNRRLDEFKKLVDHLKYETDIVADAR